ncbi:MAG: KH domain-containing protein [Verrucomicrobiota bacterium]
MKYFVEFVVRNLVEHADEVDVAEISSGRATKLQVRVNPQDVGRVIGKNGRTISSIRGLLNAAAMKSKQRVILELVEEAAVRDA